LVFGVFPERLKPDAEVLFIRQLCIDLPHKKRMILSIYGHSYATYLRKKTKKKKSNFYEKK
jgi:hypothetical protein